MWLMGVVSRRWVWLVSGIYGCFSECYCKEVYYRYPYNNYYFPLLHLYILALFLAHHPYFFVHFLNVFLFLFMLFLCNVIIKNC